MPLTAERPSGAAVAGGERLALAVVAAAAGLKLGIHLATVLITPYSVHRDELLYAAMGKYLRLFAMDFPPFIALLANAMRFVFGDTLLALRAAPAVAGAALVVLTALIARELGGGRGAQILAMLGVLLAPLFMRAAALFQPVVFDQVWWTLALLALLRIGRRGEPRDWILLGIAGGLGLLTKFSIGFIAIGMVAALLITPLRASLLTRWPYIAAGIALLIGSPSIIGQFALGFPVAGQMGDLQAGQLVHVTPLSFIAGQIRMIGPAIILSVAGVVFLLRAASMQPYRAAAWSCVGAFGILLLLGGKPYYAGPVHPLLIAAGAVALTRAAYPGIASAIIGLAILAYGAITLPLGLPIVPPEPMARYAERLGMTSATTTNQGEVIPLPQDYADMLGWEEQVAAVAAAYHGLPADERARAVLIASNYGEAGAIDWFGPRLGLPRAVAPIGSYWFFGPGDLPGDVAITLGIEPDDIAGFYDQFEVVARVANPWGVPEQQNNPIGVARGAARSLQEVWPEFAGRN